MDANQLADRLEHVIARAAELYGMGFPDAREAAYMRGAIKELARQLREGAKLEARLAAVAAEPGADDILCAYCGKGPCECAPHGIEPAQDSAATQALKWRAERHVHEDE